MFYPINDCLAIGSSVRLTQSSRIVAVRSRDNKGYVGTIDRIRRGTNGKCLLTVKTANGYLSLVKGLLPSSLGFIP